MSIPCRRRNRRERERKECAQHPRGTPEDTHVPHSGEDHQEQKIPRPKVGSKDPQKPQGLPERSSDALPTYEDRRKSAEVDQCEHKHVDLLHRSRNGELIARGLDEDAPAAYRGFERKGRQRQLDQGFQTA